MTTYKEAGVDIDAANEGLDRIKKHVKNTYNKHTISDIGSFGGCFQIPINNYKEPVLVSSVDGVGTKLLISSYADRYDTIGQCLVNHCVNDILVLGAKPMFFLDYFATGKLDNDILENVIKGFSIACKENSCVLIGGETAEMPGFYDEKKFDVSGTIVGIAEKSQLLSYRKTSSGDILIGLKSNGLHTNGYSLARKVLYDNFSKGEYVESLGNTIDDELLKIHRSYLPVLSEMLDKPWLKALSHITGGGIVENTERVIDSNQSINIDWDSWAVPKIFKLIMSKGDVPFDDMARTFNLGIGMILIIDKNHIDDVDKYLKSIEEPYTIIGEVINK